MLRGRVFDIQRFAIHDGPGIRTLVFLKGCPLRCPWCSNPEGVLPRFDVVFFRDRCTSCGRCSQVCPVGVHSIRVVGDALEHRVAFRSRCTGCGDCVAVCPNQALHIAGRDMTVGEVMRVVERDEAFYRVSGGGLTLGGGEPTQQAGFSLALLTSAKERWIHTAMETCGHCPPAVFAEILPLLDYLIIDIKHMDAETHCRVVGESNELVLENTGTGLASGKPVVVRVPVIPSFNDNREQALLVGRFVRRHTRSDAHAVVELLPYHRLGAGKYSRIGRRYSLGKLKSPLDDEVIDLARTMEQEGVTVRIRHP